MTTMFAFPGMFAPHIKDSDLKMPEDFDDFDVKEYPNFALFLASHVGFTINIEDLENNANIIAKIPEEKIENITMRELWDLGVVYGSGPLV